MEASTDIRGLQLTLVIYAVIFFMKLTAYFFSGVIAILAEAFHTLSDIFISGFLLIATVYSRKPPDEDHMFGHGRAQNVAALVSATLFVSFTSIELFREAVPRLLSAGETEYENLPLVMVVIGISMIAAAGPLVNLFRQKKRAAAAKAQFTELINDELGLLAVLLGTLFIMWGWPVGDPLAAIVVATLIASNGIVLFLDNASFLLGRSPGPEFLQKVETLARSVSGVLDVQNLRAEYVGPDTIHAGLNIVVKRGMPVEEIERVTNEVHVRVHKNLSNGYCFIQVSAEKVRAEINGEHIDEVEG